jgi:hypothetical protein
MSCSPGSACAPWTGGGWRRTCVWRERRWPNFIIWRWAGPARGGWIHCLQRAPPPQRPAHPHPLTSTNPLPRGDRVEANPAAVPGAGARLGKSLADGRPRAQARSQLGKGPRRALASLLSVAPSRPNGAVVNPRRRVGVARPGRAHANPHGRVAGSRLAGSRLAGRVPVGPLRAKAPRRAVAAGDGRPLTLCDPAAPGPRRS